MTRIQFPTPGSDAYEDAKARGAQNPLQPGEFRGGPPDEFGDHAPPPEIDLEPPPTKVPDVGKVSDPALRKALQIIETELPFVVIGLQPKGDGCDFLVSVVGSRDIIAPAAPHLAAVLNRYLKRAGFTV